MEVLRGGDRSIPRSRPARSNLLGILNGVDFEVFGSDCEACAAKKIGAVQSISQSVMVAPSGAHAGHLLSCSASITDTALAISSDMFTLAKSCKSTPLRRANERQNAARRIKRRMQPT
jgi:hypothetical protein